MSSINPSSNSPQSTLISWETATALTKKPEMQQSVPAQADSVHMNSQFSEATLLDDAEAQAVLEQTQAMIVEDPYSALYAHSGLDASRVAALLA